MEYDFKLSQQELNLIYLALGEVPLKVSLNVYAKLQQEQQKQDEAKAVPIESLTEGS
jgi:hypothetical protein